MNIFKLVHKLYRATAQVSDMTDGSLVCLFSYMMNLHLFTHRFHELGERGFAGL